MNTTKKTDKGFTLVELLIVIVILGILATVTVFAVRGITDQGKQSTCDSDRKTLEVAVEAYFANNNADPASEADLIPSFVKSDSPNYDIAAGGVISPSQLNPNGCS